MTGIRPAREADLPRLQDIERAAGRAFADLGMHLVAEDAPPSEPVPLHASQDTEEGTVTVFFAPAKASSSPISMLVRRSAPRPEAWRCRRPPPPPKRPNISSKMSSKPPKGLPPPGPPPMPPSKAAWPMRS